MFYDMSQAEKFRDIHYAKGTDWLGIICPQYEGHQRAGERIGNIRANITTKKVGDFMSTFLSEWVMNDRVLELFSANNISGYTVKPVEICNQVLPYRFWEFVVIGKGGDAHPDSGIHLLRECPYCGAKKYSAYENGIIVDETNWDGSDIFTVTGYSRHILVTEKVKEIVESNHLTGVKFIPSNEVRWPVGISKPV